VKAIQVKCGTARLSRAERERLEGLAVAPCVTKEYWLFKQYARKPVIEILQTITLVSVTAA